MARIRFQHGQHLPGFYCVFCDAKRDGRIYRELFEYNVYLECGHKRKIGYVLPFEELERRGYINADAYNPQGESKKAQLIREGVLQMEEQKRRVEQLKGLTRNKIYF